MYRINVVIIEEVSVARRALGMALSIAGFPLVRSIDLKLNARNGMAYSPDMYLLNMEATWEILLRIKHVCSQVCIVSFDPRFEIQKSVLSQNLFDVHLDKEERLVGDVAEWKIVVRFK